MQSLSLLLERSFSVLSLAARNAEGLRIADVARLLHLPMSTAHRLVQALAKAGVLEPGPRTGTFVPGQRVLESAYQLVGNLSVREAALDEMRQLRDEMGESVFLSIRSGSNRICVEALEGRHELRVVRPVGQSWPLHIGCSGKVLLAYMTSEEQDDVLARVKPFVRANGTLADAALIRRELAEIRAQGYAVTHSERLERTCSFGAPLWQHDGTVCASLVIGIPEWRCDSQDEIVAGLLRAARAISRKLHAPEHVYER